MTGKAEAVLEQAARPLLELMQAITGLETSFITGIDWDAQEQEVQSCSRSTRRTL